MNFRRLLVNLFRRRSLEGEMSAEMRHHLDEQAAQHARAGLAADEARDAAQRQFGNLARIQEEVREQRGWLWLEQGSQDVRFGLRGLAKARGYTAVAMLTLALGIGTTTAIFSVIYGVLVDPYPYAKSNEIWAPFVIDRNTGRQVGLRLADYEELAKLPAVQAAMATTTGGVTLSGGPNPEIVQSPQLTGTAFAFLDVPPVLGRGLTPADFQANGDALPVTVLSFKFWQSRFNGDPQVLGRTIVLDDIPHTIVGVMPPRFGWYGSEGLWRPLPTTTNLTRGAAIIVRLKPGITPAVADQQLNALLQAQAIREPGRFPKDGFTAQFKNYLDVTVASGEMRTSLIILLWAVGFLLLIACTNVANLQLARGAGRGREMGVRLALGAARGRLVRQLLTESTLLSLAGGALGVLFAWGLVQLIVALMPNFYVPNEARVTMNGWVLAFSTTLAILAGIGSGLLPAWQGTKADVNEALKDGGQGSGNRRGNRLRQGLAVAQVALSVILLVGASVMTLSFVRLQHHDRAFRTDNMLVLRVPLSTKRYTTYEQRIAFARDFLGRLRNQPGVVNASLGLPPSFENRSGFADLSGSVKPAEGISLNSVDFAYLETYGLRVKAGRYFTEAEIERGERVALISEAAARLWPEGVDPLGHTLTVDALVGGGTNNLPAPNAKKEVTIIGVLADVYIAGPNKPAPTVLFVPYTLRAPASRAFVLQTRVAPGSLLNAARTELRALDKEQPMQRPITFDDFIEEQAQQPRFNMALFASLAGIALMLAAAGIYAVLSYAVAQRSREIGVRMALGAAWTDVQRLFLMSGLRLVGFGLAVGLLTSLGLARVVQSRVTDVPWLDPLAFGAALAVLTVTALVACLIPARRATKVDPMVALRAE
jgi:putative ABC transport system permease protein